MEKIFGIHAVKAVLQREPQRIERLYCQQGRHDQRLNEILELAQQHKIACESVDRHRLDELSSKSNDDSEAVHQGVVALAQAAQPLTEKMLWNLLDFLDHTPFLLVLDGVTDPHNLGACLRTADAAGVDAVIIPKHRAVGLNATVRKVACGAAEVMPLVVVKNLAQTLKQLQQRGIWLTGTAGEAEQSIHALDLTGPLALVMGAEGEGMRRLTREHCDYLAHIPMYGSVSSLNVSVATGVCLFEAQRQRMAAKPS